MDRQKIDENGAWMGPAPNPVVVNHGASTIRRGPVRDPAVLEQLEIRRATRLQHQAFQPVPAY